MLKPVVKWAGGKYKLAPSIIDIAKEKINFYDYDTYVDPFVGGGGMLFYIGEIFNFKNKIISDINPELINMYLQIRDKPDQVIKRLDELEKEFNALSSDVTRQEKYLEFRNLYNKNIDQQTLDVGQAGLMIALNKLCFNGLYRVNRDGHFNVPFGKKKKAVLYDYENIYSVGKFLLNTEIYLSDFKESAKFANKNALYYLDSPYRPLPNSNSFTTYSKSDFNDIQQAQLGEFCKEITLLDANFILSNSDPKQVNPDDNFFDDLYEDFDIYRIEARRAIGATAVRRGLVSEILVIGKN